MLLARLSRAFLGENDDVQCPASVRYSNVHEKRRRSIHHEVSNEGPADMKSTVQPTFPAHADQSARNVLSPISVGSSPDSYSAHGGFLNACSTQSTISSETSAEAQDSQSFAPVAVSLGPCSPEAAQSGQWPLMPKNRTLAGCALAAATKAGQSSRNRVRVIWSPAMVTGAGASMFVRSASLPGSHSGLPVATAAASWAAMQFWPSSCPSCLPRRLGLLGVDR